MQHKKGIYEKYFKRPQDLFLASFALLGLSPVLLVIGVLVRTKIGRPMLFSQNRPGRNEKVFSLYKFRTMTDQRDEKGELLPDDDRLTSFGRFLRSTSLDELPELFNVVRGDMAVIGPRPLLVKYLPLYNEKQKRRHEVRPGLSGLAQVNGRNAISWEEKFDLDIRYVDNVSYMGDWEILFKTVKKVFVRADINDQNDKIMEDFRGTK